MTYLKKEAERKGTPPQSEPLDKRQVPNSAGGFSYAVDDWKRLDRFLILGERGRIILCYRKETYCGKCRSS